MSYLTQPTYLVSVPGWDPRTREHPVIDWMFDYEDAFDWGDMKSGPHTPWHSDDFTFTKPTGVSSPPGAPSWAALLEKYAPFSAHYHEPLHFIVYETSSGYELTGVANIFANLQVPGEKTKSDLQGRKWEIQAPGAFHFVYEKDPSGPKGLKIKSQELYADGIPLVGEMVKRGMVTWDQVTQQS